MTEDLEPVEVAEPPESSERTFDFTAPVETYDDDTKSVYYRLRRAAKLYGGELPEGKIYTGAEVAAILGEDYAANFGKACC